MRPTPYLTWPPPTLGGGVLTFLHRLFSNSGVKGAASQATPSQNNELSTSLLLIGNSSARKFQNFHFLQNSKWDKIKRILKQGEGDDDDYRANGVENK